MPLLACSVDRAAYPRGHPGRLLRYAGANVHQGLIGGEGDKRKNSYSLGDIISGWCCCSVIFNFRI